MRIEHVALYVNNLEPAKRFFENFFGARSNDGYYNPNTGLRTFFLSFGDGSRLELMNRPGMDDSEKSALRTGYIHLAFSTGGREQVDRLTAALADAGYRVLSGPRTTGDGYYESCVEGPEGNLIELTE